MSGNEHYRVTSSRPLDQPWRRSDGQTYYASDV